MLAMDISDSPSGLGPLPAWRLFACCIHISVLVCTRGSCFLCSHAVCQSGVMRFDCACLCVKSLVLCANVAREYCHIRLRQGYLRSKATLVIRLIECCPVL